MDFSTWLLNSGGRVHPELDLFYTLPSGDRGVVARSDISEGQLLLLLPINCAIYIPTEEEFKRHPDAFPDAVQYLREAHPGLSPFLATTLVLMSEMTRGSASTWASYVAILPPSCPDCLINWSDEEKQELAGTSLEQFGPDPASDVYRRHVAPILAARKDLWPGLAAAEAAEAADRGVDPGLTAFLRAAGLLQSRAFHLEAENWVSGAKEISRLEDGGTQVFLLPGIDMINHSHNPARRNAHLERLNLAQAATAKLLDGAASAEAPSLPAGVEAVFVMRADKPIKAGEEVLHTYGNLSDAQLLQTYGFLDSEDDLWSETAAAGVSSVLSPSAKKRTKAGGGGDSSGGYRNPYNAALVPWITVEEVCMGLLSSMNQAPSSSTRRAKQEFLATAGVLQAAAPESTQFVLLAQEPLPDEFMTAVQVLLMTADEFQELQREFGDPSKLPAGSKRVGRGPEAGGTSCEAAAAAAAVAATAAEGASTAKLSLGTALLEEDQDFAEMVCIASLQILAACMERYPTNVKDDVRLLRSPDCTGRQRLAVRVRLGEKDVIQLAKKAVVELMSSLRRGWAGEGSRDEEEKESDDEAAAAEEEREENVGRRRASKRQRRGLGAPPSEEPDREEDDENGSSADGSDLEGSSDSDDQAADELLMGSDDSDKVGYGAEEYDDGIGEVHDRGKPHEAPTDD
ncbi:hypothetical protein VaNZ11_015450 [Volvox africanus]|uniref:SET domain-containing protein n=1 Tax=Volvox africanus TaxID=51714 RepID=A0ABQ5SLZ3_9CHLO|nr:hypothetical protein VaNZ11_015450 [Volvox africanus]